jgi:hypothetical protein
MTGSDANPESGDELNNIEVPGSLALRAPRNDRETKMMGTLPGLKDK